MACGSMNRLPLVPADRSMQAWPMATPTPTVLICAKHPHSQTLHWLLACHTDHSISY